MRKLFNKFKYKYTTLSILLCFLLLYTIHFYMNHSIFKFLLWIIVSLIPVSIKQYEEKLNKKK